MRRVLCSLLAGLTLAQQQHNMFYVASLSLEQLRDNSNRHLGGWLEDFGIVSVTDVPGLQAARTHALTQLNLCATKNSEGFRSTTLLDGTLRRTTATKTDFLTPEPLAQELALACPEFAAATVQFRNIITNTSGEFLAALDRLYGSDTKILMPNPHHQPVFAGVIHREGTQLEHFVSLSPSSSSSSSSSAMTVDLHTDDGLFIAFTPALLLSKDTRQPLVEADSGLLLERNGEVVTPVFQQDSVVFMLGDGLAKWLSTTQLQLRGVRHGVNMPTNGVTRAWYGRMFLPPALAVSPSMGLTFQSYRDITNQAASNNDSSALAELGCMTVTTRGEEDLLAQCPPDEYHCWMRCYTRNQLPTCRPPSQLACLRDSDGSVCDPNDHNCSPRCT